MVTPMRQWLTATLLLTLSICTTGCNRYRLARPIACEDMLRLKLGQTEEQVRTLIGPPVATIPTSFAHLKDGTPVDAVAHYGPTDTPDGYYSVWDVMEAYYSKKQLVAVFAVENRWRRAGHTLALRLHRSGKSDAGQDEREIGPAFESMFTCGPGFSRDQAARDMPSK